MSIDRTRIFSMMFVVLVIVFTILACSWLPENLVPGVRTTPVPIKVEDNSVKTDSASGEEGGAFGMDITLSEGNPQPQDEIQNPVVSGEPLTPEEMQVIFDRLPELPVDKAEQMEFKLPSDTLPPPRPGVTINEVFPPLMVSPTPGSASAGPLQVLRYAPEGEIPIAPFISVTFDQPMVPMATLADLAALEVPVKISPSLPGTWRWLGTKTLTFEYDSDLIDRLPKATEYRVTIPAGTRSVTGGVLANEVSWTFSTPPPKALVTYPYDIPQPLEPLFFIAFDQRIDPESVLKTISVQAGSQTASLRLATEDEVKNDPAVSRLVENASEGRWLVFRARDAFPPETHIMVSIGPGTPSAEGPLLSTETQTYQFSTYAPLRIEEHYCYWGDDECPPLTPFVIRFNNPLDMKVFEEDMLTVTPEIPGVVANAYGTTIEIKGQTRGRTTYTVTVSGQLRDEFGQTLGKDQSIKFKVGSAEPVLVGPRESFITLDPSSTKPLYSVYATNYKSLDLKIYSVKPEDWPGYIEFLREWNQTDEPVKIPGKLVLDKSLPLDLPADTLSQVDIDLSPYLEGQTGHLVVSVAPPKPLIETNNDKWRRFYQMVHTWVQVTQVGLDVLVDHSTMLAWATDLQDGSPLSGVSIHPSTGGPDVLTDDDGTARFDIPSGAVYLVAKLGSDEALLPKSLYAYGDDSWWASPPSDELRWYVFDDRKMYRPEEEVHIKGWMRKIGGGQNGDVSLVGDGISGVAYSVIDPQGNELVVDRADVNDLGGFDFSFTIPAGSNLGTAQLQLYVEGSSSSFPGSSYYHYLEVQEFRRPEFEVTARNESLGPYFVGNQAVVAVDANYYAGGALPNAEVNWQVTSRSTNYSPPNWPEFTFGTWQPWWWFYDGEDGFEDGETKNYSGKTDNNGTHYLMLDFSPTGDPALNPRPQSVTAEARVMDVNRQEWASSTYLLVHPASNYIGLRSERYFVELNAPLKVDYIVTDLDGNPMPGRPVVITAERLEWKNAGGDWMEEAVDSQICEQSSSTEPGYCIFKTPIGGKYQITAVVTDEQGRSNQSRFNRWVSGGKLPPSRKVEQETVTLIPDKETYEPGDTARILVQAPFSPAEGILTISRSGILETRRFTIEEDSITLEVPIRQEHIPNLEIQVDLNGSSVRIGDDGFTPLTDVPARPAYALGTLSLRIPPIQRALSLDVSPDEDQLEPGSETMLSVVVKDAAGDPVPDAEIAVVVVDEAILALTGYQLTDPLNVFYTNRPSMVYGSYARSSIVLIDPLALASQSADKGTEVADMMEEGALRTMMPLMESAPMEMPSAPAGMGGGAPDQAPINVRSDFNPLAAFVPAARTGLDGSARIRVKVPDNLTRYRVMVVAVNAGGNHFGTGESSITARLPLMVRPSAPRFLNFGDVFELPVVLQNQTDEPMLVSLVARAANLNLTGAGVRVTIPANDRIEVRIDSSADMAGTALIQFAAVSGRFSDAATVELPVYTPATTEAFATYGVIDDGVSAQPVQYPTGVFPQFGGLEVTTSSTALQALTDAVLYLSSYPFECSEQLASRVLAVAALRDVLTAFEADGLPAPEEMISAVDRDIQRLSGMQNYDGGFPTWRRGFDSNPFNTIHVAHALARASQKGFEVPMDMKLQVNGYLQEIESHYPAWYSERTRRTLSAYALYVRNLMDDRDVSKAESLMREAGLDGMPMQAIGWLWPSIDSPELRNQIKVFVNNHVVESAGAANFTTDYDDQSYLLLSSDRRTDAVLLEAIMADDPQSDLIPKLVNGLLAHRTRGRWGSTQENVFVLLSLDKYFNLYESTTPDFVARLWLGNAYAGSSEFRDRSTDYHNTMIPMTYVLSSTAEGTQDLVISKDGAGRLYYRIGLQYAPTDLDIEPLDMGFVIQRSYEAVDDPADVRRDADGTWHIKAGATVRVKISMVADNRRYHVALVDPLPAGLEIVNPALEVSGSVPQDPDSSNFRYGWWWWGTWYEHQNLRDDRAEAFTSLLWDGVYEYSYTARATTPGTFVVPPAKAEEMYSPEVFGRSGGDRVIVE